MAKSVSSPYVITLLITILMIIWSTPKALGGGVGAEEITPSWITSAGRNRCQGSIAECSGDDGTDEFAMDSEVNRRILQATSGIQLGYQVLRRDFTPCSQGKGQSYYNSNCNSANTPVNSYNRNCAQVNRCRGGS